VIRYAIWLYFRFTLSFRDVEEMLAERGIDLSYETIRCWTIKFGPQITMNLRRRRLAPTSRWHLDEMLSAIGGKPVWIWRAVDDEGEVLDLVLQKRRDTAAALRLLKRLLRNQPVELKTIVTDGLKSYKSALKELGLEQRHQPGRLRHNNSRRELTFADTAAGAEDAALQVASVLRRPVQLMVLSVWDSCGLAELS